MHRTQGPGWESQDATLLDLTQATFLLMEGKWGVWVHQTQEMKGKEGTGYPGGQDAQSGRYSSGSGLCPSGEKGFFADVSYLRHHIFKPHGTPTSMVSDGDPKFTSPFWQQSMKSMGIEHIKAVPGYHETNGQVERKSSQLKTALRNITNKRQNNWVNSLQDMAAYTNAGHSNTISMSPYKAVYGRDYPLLATYRIEGTAVPSAKNILPHVLHTYLPVSPGNTISPYTPHASHFSVLF